MEETSLTEINEKKGKLGSGNASFSEIIEDQSDESETIIGDIETE